MSAERHEGSSLCPGRLSVIIDCSQRLQEMAMDAAAQIAADRVEQGRPQLDGSLKQVVHVMQMGKTIEALAQEMLEEAMPLLEKIEQEEALAQRAQIETPLH